MQKGQFTLFVVFLGIVASAAAGDVWINCAPGLDIFLDGESVGVSDVDENGKHLRGIESGDHTIRIEKYGIALAEFSVTVGFALNQVEFGELAAGVTEEPSGTSQEAARELLVGAIEITSDPEECNVKIGSRRILKKYPLMTIPGIPAGEHKLWFENSGTVLSETVLVQPAEPAKVLVDFRNQRVAITGATRDIRAEGSAGEEESPRAEPECIEYWMQVMRTSNIEDVEAVSSALKSLGFPDYRQKVITVEEDGTLPTYKIRVGPVPHKSETKYPLYLLQQAGFKSVWVVPEKCRISPPPTPKPKFKPIH
jgi:cell division septation protein DedD